MRQGKTRQRSKPLSQREASRDSKAAAWKQTMDKVLQARRAQETKGVEDVVHKFRDEEACLRKQHLPNCSMVESWFWIRIRIRARLGSATERGCSSCWDGQLQEDRTLDKEFA